jgi:SAM-dependent methyltransferase
MHAEVWTFVARAARDITARRLRVVEIGAREVNGSVRPIFEGHDYTGVDLAPGPGVDIIDDGALFGESGVYDIGICCETLEHSRVGSEIVANLRRIVRPGGLLIITCATEPRPPHSGVDGGPLRAGEFYANVPPRALLSALDGCPYINLEIERGDLRAIATVS